MSSTPLSLPLPLAITHATLRDEATVIDQAPIATAALSADARKTIEALAAALSATSVKATHAALWKCS